MSAKIPTGVDRSSIQMWFKGDVVVFLFSGIALAFCVAFAAFWPASLISLLVSIIYVIAILKERPEFIFKYLAWFVTYALIVGGIVSVEFTDIYLSRLSVNAHFVGSMPLLMLGYWLFFMTLMAYDSKFGVEKTYNEKPLSMRTNVEAMRYLTYFMFAAVLFCFSFVLLSPSFITGLNRFEYLGTQIPSITRYIGRVLDFMVIIPILYCKQAKSKFAIATIALYCVYLFWINTKFGTFLSIFTIIVLVYYDSIFFYAKSKLYRLVAGAALLVLVLVCVAALAHSFTSTISTSDYLAERLAGEGELWWRTYELLDGNSYPAEFSNEVEALWSGKTRISDNVGSHYGIYGIMYFASPESTVNSVLSKGWRFTEAGFAAAYYYFGIFGIIGFGVFSGLLVAFIQNSLLRAIRQAKPIKASVLVYFSNLAKTAVGMFLFVEFLRPISIIFYLYLILEKLLTYQRFRLAFHNIPPRKARPRE